MSTVHWISSKQDKGEFKIFFTFLYCSIHIALLLLAQVYSSDSVFTETKKKSTHISAVHSPSQLFVLLFDCSSF